MKIYKPLVYQWLSILLIVGGLIFAFSSLYSCSDSKMIQYHFKKAEKHGGKIVCDTTYIEVPTIVKGKDGRDSIVYVLKPIECEPCQPCETKTRFEIKWKYKYDLKRMKAREAFIIDSLEQRFVFAIKHAKIEGKQQKQVSKQQTKNETANNKSFNLFTWFLIIAVCLAGLIFFYTRFIPK